MVSTVPRCHTVWSIGFFQGEPGIALAGPVAEAAPEPAVIAETDAGILEHFGRREEDIGGGATGPGRRDPRLGRAPQQILDALGLIGRLAERDVAVEIAVIAGIFGTGIDEQDV